jgi:hypothetical protein
MSDGDSIGGRPSESSDTKVSTTRDESVLGRLNQAPTAKRVDRIHRMSLAYRLDGSLQFLVDFGTAIGMARGPDRV